MSDYQTDANLVTGERAQIEAFVADNRREVVALLDGLTEEQARRRLVPSKTSVLSLVTHCTFVERVWFDVALEGRTRAELGLPESVDESFDLDDDDTVESVRAGYLAAVASAEDIASRHSLDDDALHNRRSPMSLRWIYLHLVEELARHAGHGDILREQILAEAE
jgi:uncharacterized damage-inducible protein DinB